MMLPLYQSLAADRGRRKVVDAMTATVRDKTICTSNGELCYTTHGSGPAVVAIQGVGVPGCGWRPQIDALSSLFTIVTPDNCGIGRTPRGSDALTIGRMAEDVAAIAEAEGFDRFHLIGHSMGGLIAQHLALTSPKRIESLALLCTFANGADATRLSLRMFVLGLRTRIGTRAMRRMGMIRMVMPDGYLHGKDVTRLAQELGELFGRDLADQPPIVSEQLGAMSRYSALDRLPELSGIPTLVLSATHDPIAPPELGRALASAIAGSRFLEFPQASHALPIQCAQEVNALLLEHWTRTERAG
jgi:aminoacrylate hydrolase